MVRSSYLLFPLLISSRSFHPSISSTPPAHLQQQQVARLEKELDEALTPAVSIHNGQQTDMPSLPGDTSARRPAHQQVANIVADAMLAGQEAGDRSTLGMQAKTLHIVPDLVSGFRGSVPPELRLDFYLHPQGETDAPLDSASTMGTGAVILPDMDRVLFPAEVTLNDATNDLSVTIVLEANIGGDYKPLAKVTVPSAAFCDALQCSKEYDGPVLHSVYYTHIITTLKLDSFMLVLK